MVFLPTVPAVEYHALVAASTVLLDPFPFGGGVTTLEALAQCKPVLTVPSAQSVPRLAAGMLARIGLADDLVAPSETAWVDAAVALGTNATLRADVEARTCARQAELFDDREAADEWARVLRRVAAR